MGPRSLNAPSAHLHLILGTVKKSEALTVNPFINTLQAMISSLLLLSGLSQEELTSCFLLFTFINVKSFREKSYAATVQSTSIIKHQPLV